MQVVKISILAVLFTLVFVIPFHNGIMEHSNCAASVYNELNQIK